MNRLCLIFVVVAALSTDATRAADPRQAPLTKERLKQQAALIAEFRKARQSPEIRMELIDRAADLSPFTLKGILETVAKDLNKPLLDYRQSFMNEVAKVVSQRANSGSLQEIAELRAQILAITSREDLTKEMIVEISDPRLKRLKGLIFVDRELVFQQNPDLRKKREALQTLGQQWEKCAARLLEVRVEKLPDAKPVRDAQAVKKAEPVRETEEVPIGAVETAAEEVAVRPPSFDEYLLKEEEIATALALPMDAATRSVLATNSQLSGKMDAEEARCVLVLNLTRILLGRPPVRIDLTLTAVARDHSSDMERLGFYSHDSPLPGKTTPWDRAKRANTTAAGENIAAGTLDGAEANEMWWHSPGHHKNMLSNHVRVGVGRSGQFWTEMFGR